MSAKPANAFPKAGALVALLILGVVALGMGAAIQHFKVSIRKLPIYPKDNRQTREVAAESASWVRIGADQTISKEVEEELGTTNHLSRTYFYKKSPDKNNPVIIELHLAYYTGMIDTVPHVPDRCFVGAGMVIDGDAGTVPVPLSMDGLVPDEEASAAQAGRVFRVRATNPTDAGKKVDGIFVHLPRDPDKIEMKITKFSGPKIPRIYSGYFFVANGGTVATGDGVRLLAFDLKSKYAYYMKVQFTSATVQSAEELAKYAGLFLDENFADIMLCVPDWVEVEAGRYPPKEDGDGPDVTSAGSAASAVNK